MTLDEAIAVLRSPEGREETRRVHQLHRAFDLAVQVIYSGSVPREDAERLVDEVAQLAERLFPGSRATFDIVYARRLKRVIDEQFGTAN